MKILTSVLLVFVFSSAQAADDDKSKPVELSKDIQIELFAATADANAATVQLQLAAQEAQQKSAALMAVFQKATSECNTGTDHKWTDGSDRFKAQRGQGLDGRGQPIPVAKVICVEVPRVRPLPKIPPPAK